MSRDSGSTSSYIDSSLSSYLSPAEEASRRPAISEVPQPLPAPNGNIPNGQPRPNPFANMALPVRIHPISERISLKQSY